MHRSPDDVRRRDSDAIETAATVLLSVAGFATSWAGYQASLWSGNQIQHANDSIALRARSARASTLAGQLTSIDVGLFNSWLVERGRDPAVAGFIAARFRPEFKSAFESWMQTDPLHSPTAVPSPFALPVYHLSAGDTAEHYQVAADSALILSDRANNASDAYVFYAILLAGVMFFAGTAQRITRIGLRWGLIGLASVACLFGIVRLFTLPRG